MHLKSDQPLYLDVLQKLILMKTNMPYFLLYFLLIIDIHSFAAAKLRIFFQILLFSIEKTSIPRTMWLHFPQNARFTS